MRRRCQTKRCFGEHFDRQRAMTSDPCRRPRTTPGSSRTTDHSHGQPPLSVPADRISFGWPAGRRVPETPTDSPGVLLLAGIRECFDAADRSRPDDSCPATRPRATTSASNSTTPSRPIPEKPKTPKTPKTTKTGGLAPKLFPPKEIGAARPPPSVLGVLGVIDQRADRVGRCREPPVLDLNRPLRPTLAMFAR